MAIKLIIFDLDGTLLDTLTDLAVSVNHALEQHQFPAHAIEEYKQFVGNGARALIRRALPFERQNDGEINEMVLHTFLSYYTDHLNDFTRPYAGIEELLSELHRQWIVTAVATNKPQAEASKVIPHYFPDHTFVAIEGELPERPIKPDPQIVHDILSQLDYSVEEALYVGDSGVDMRTAAAAGLRSVGCLWGFRSANELLAHGAQALITHPSELLQLL